MIPIFEPFLDGNEKKYLDRCIETNWISSQGDFILEFERQFASYHGAAHCIVTSSCTSALHIGLVALGLGPGDEVICPDLTFIAPANMIALSGAKLVLVDVDSETLAIDPELLEANITDRTKAIVVVHQFGHAAPMDEIMDVAGRCNLQVIEDNAESLGGRYKGKLLGTMGALSCFSFFANKIITTGEGGAIITDDQDLAERCRTLRDHGMSPEKRYHHVELGFNYRMTNMQAAIGLAQLEQLDSILSMRRRQMEAYSHALDGISGVQTRRYKDWCEPVHWLTTIRLDERHDRDEFLRFMKEEGIDCRQMVNPVHEADHFSEYGDEAFPTSRTVSVQSAHLPSSTGLSEEQIEAISGKVREFTELS
jgi:perosamine synthetase